MHIEVDGVRLYFDVDGAGLVPDGATMRQRPVLLLLHGGPGADHSLYKPAFSALTDVAQVVYLDHRGNGRSEAGDPADWTLARWGDDVRAFCDALGIERPVVYGASFGGLVAQAYATRHPDHPAGLVLVSTDAVGGQYIDERVAMFERLGGPALGQLAHRRLVEKAADPETLEAWIRDAVPHYTRAPFNPDVISRWVRKPEVTHWFTRAGGEGERYDFRNQLGAVRCPTLVLGGEDDPVMPIQSQRDLAAALPTDLVRFEAFANCGHGVMADANEAAMRAVRDFLVELAPTA